MGATLTCFEVSSGPDPYEGPHSHHHNDTGILTSIHQQVGNSVARSLRDEQNQAVIAGHVGTAAKNKDYQKQVGGMGRNIFIFTNKYFLTNNIQ